MAILYQLQNDAHQYPHAVALCVTGAGHTERHPAPLFLEPRHIASLGENARRYPGVDMQAF